MKKLLVSSLITCLALPTLFTPAYAVEYPNPSVYFMQIDEANEPVSNTVFVSSEDIANGDVVIDVGIYIKDTSNLIQAFVLQWESNSDYITCQNILDPNAQINPDTQYTLKGSDTTFSTTKTPSCFGTINSRGNYSFQGSLSVNYDTNSLIDPLTGRYSASKYLRYDCGNSSATWFSNNSDDYYITEFETVIKKDTPDGIYTLYFLDKDSGTENFANGHFKVGEYGTKVFYPNLKSLTIQVGDLDYTLGDVNNDDSIDSFDASLVLTEYATLSSNKPSTFTKQQTLSADVNKDGSIDSFDASKILIYYAEKSSNGNPEF